VFAEIGLAIKEKSPFKPTFTIELANGLNGYCRRPNSTNSAATKPGGRASSYLEVDASTKIFDTLMELFAKLR